MMITIIFFGFRSTCSFLTMPKKKEETWLNSKAKKLLKADIISGMILATTGPKAVYAMRAEYNKWPYDNFRSNLRSLRLVIISHKKRMQDDCAFYGHDCALHERRHPCQDRAVPWHKSQAKIFLLEDIASGKHTQMIIFSKTSNINNDKNILHK